MTSCKHLPTSDSTKGGRGLTDLWLLLLLRNCENITDEGVDAIADKCRGLRDLRLA